VALATTRAFSGRRRSELGLLLVGAIAVVYASLLPALALTGALPDHEVAFLGALGIVIVLVQLANRYFVPEADPILVPVALLLNGLGYVMIGRVDPASAGQQVVWTAVGILVYIGTLITVKRTRDLDRYRYVLLFLAMGLLVSPLVPVLGESINGARLWVHLGGAEFQPVEIAKLLLVFFFASYFIDKREMLTIPTRRVGNHLLPDLRAFGPMAVAGAIALLIILAEHDIGFSLMLFVTFLAMVWITTGRWTYLVIGIIVFALGTFVAAHVLAQLNQRITVWLDPWKYASTGGYQPIQGELAIARGGLFGTGLGLGSGAATIPYPTSDFIFAVVGEELGLIGAVAVATGYLLMVGCGIRTALRARTDFAKLVAFGLTMLLGFQAFLIMGGVTRLLPLTGVTLPFMSYGGSSLVANYALLAILMRISNESNQDPELR
jgi:peptidoglycan glycosyltransferase